MLACYLGVGGCPEEKCVNLLPTCAWVSGGYAGDRKSRLKIHLENNA